MNAKNILKQIQLKFLNSGKKEKIENFFLTIQLLSKKEKKNFIMQFYNAITMLEPLIETLHVKKRGKIYQIPTIISASRSTKIALRWFKIGVTKRKEAKLSIRFLNELNDILLKRKCHSLDFKNNMYQVALDNRAFLHFRWK